MNNTLDGPSYINVKNESQIIHNSTKMLNLEDYFAYSNTEEFLQRQQNIVVILIQLDNKYTIIAICKLNRTKDN